MATSGLPLCNGVARFDGVRFTTFDKSNTPGITTNRFAAIAEGANGDLWLDAENGALTQYHHGKFHTLDASDGISPSSVHGITSDRAGDVWILSNGKILKWDNAANKFKPIDDGGALSYKSPCLGRDGILGRAGKSAYLLCAWSVFAL